MQGDNTDSESSRRDIVSMWPILPRKLHVIPLGINDAYVEHVIKPQFKPLEGMGVRWRYLLYMGGSSPCKQLDWAICVPEVLSDPKGSLVACGVEKATQEKIRGSISEELRPRIMFGPFIDEALMPALYHNAAAVLYPTLYEGFGFPALEAQAFGTPVLFSALGSLAELQGPGAVVLPPEDLDARVSVRRRLVAERGEDSKPDERSRGWARGFSWDVCAPRHVDVYRMVAACIPRPRGAAIR
jgi:glycosyltransferase involved in cell wall biosynthesis